jgi:hypothetical protein
MPSISIENDRVGGKDKVYDFYTMLKLEKGEESKNKLAEAVKIYENRIKFYNESIARFDRENNAKCKKEAEDRRDKYLGLNGDLFEIVRRDKLTFDDIASGLEKYKNNTFDLGDDEYDYLGKPVSVDADAKRIEFRNGNQIYLVDKQDDGSLRKIELNSSGNVSKTDNFLKEESFFVIAQKGGSKKSIRKTKRNKKKSQTKRCR